MNPAVLPPAAHVSSWATAHRYRGLDSYEWQEQLLIQNYTYILLDAELQTSILDHIDAVVFISRPEKIFALLQLDEHHVATQLQEEGLLEMTQDPTNMFTLQAVTGWSEVHSFNYWTKAQFWGASNFSFTTFKNCKH